VLEVLDHEVQHRTVRLLVSHGRLTHRRVRVVWKRQDRIRAARLSSSAPKRVKYLPEMTAAERSAVEDMVRHHQASGCADAAKQLGIYTNA
jgi:hypothetical protein